MVYGQMVKLTSNYSEVTFRDKVYAKRLKINQVIYETVSSGNYFMLIIISGWCKDFSYNNTPYTKNIILPRTSGVGINYEAVPNSWDIEFNESRNISTQRIEVYINNDPSISDIDASNPVYLEILYE